MIYFKPNPQENTCTRKSREGENAIYKTFDLKTVDIGAFAHYEQLLHSLSGIL